MKVSTCLSCGKPFRYNPSGRTGKYCSQRCYISSSPRQVSSVCVNCGTKFKYHPSQRSGKYCSHRCYTEHDTRLRERTGINFRKQIMRAGMYHDTTMMKVWARLRKAPPKEQDVILDDLIRESESTRQEVKRYHSTLTKARKKQLRKLKKELDEQVRRYFGMYPEDRSKYPADKEPDD